MHSATDYSPQPVRCRTTQFELAHGSAVPGLRGAFGFLVVLVAICVTAPIGCTARSAMRGGLQAADADAERPLSAAERVAQLESFDMIWTTIRDEHWDPTLGGLDWGAVRSELRPKVAAAATADAARDVMFDMIQRLRQSHFNLIPARVYEELAQPAAVQRGDGTAGMRIAIVEGQALVRSVEPRSAAAEAGIAPGWVVARIGDEEIAPLLLRISKTYADSTLREARLIGAVEGRLEARAGDVLQVGLLDADNQAQVRAITLQTPPGNRVGLGNLPPQYVRLEQRTLAGDVAYVSLNVFLDPQGVMKSMSAAVATFADAPGMVLDLRGNPGGIAAMGTGLAGYFLRASKLALGTMHTRDSTVKLTINPRVPTFDGPLAVLIDGASASTSEFVAGGLKDLGRARVFGSRSAGAALPSVITRLPNGDGFQYAIASYVSIGGAALEGAGVQPDEEVAPTRAALLQGRDPALDAAVRWIEAQGASRAAAARARTSRNPPERDPALTLEKTQ